MTRSKHLIGPWLALAATLIISTSLPAVGAAGTGARYQYSFGGQIPPPIHVQPYFNDFVPVFGAFKAIEESDAPRKPTFIEWCVVCGVDDARTLMAMHILHTWAERVNFDPRRHRPR